MVDFKRGEIPLFRDGVALASVEYPFPVLSYLLRSATREGELEVTDFGGYFGTTYLQVKSFVPRAKLRWAVVEVPANVAMGRELIADEQLTFHESLAEAQAAAASKVLLVSGVLPYMEHVERLAAEFSRFDFELILIDRTVVIDGPRSRIALQTNGSVSWPVRLMTRHDLLALFEADYEVHAEFASYCDPDGVADDGTLVRYRGFALQRCR